MGDNYYECNKRKEGGRKFGKTEKKRMKREVVGIDGRRKGEKETRMNEVSWRGNIIGSRERKNGRLKNVKEAEGVYDGWRRRYGRTQDNGRNSKAQC